MDIFIRVHDAHKTLMDQPMDAPKIFSELEAILDDAVACHISDVHMFLSDDRVHVDYRHDGLLRTTARMDKTLWNKTLVRLKVLADLDIAESRRPQFGSFRYRYQYHDYDLRVSLHPTSSGEKVALRILYMNIQHTNLADLGYQSNSIQILESCLQQPAGLILVVGPTGAGKTTTLYTLLHQLISQPVSIATLEDPIECRMEGLHQSAINDKMGFTYANGIRSLLRQDLDVMFIGEIRDEETARMVFRATLTGHLVLSTLHAHCTLSSILRLVDLGVSLTDIAHNTIAIVAQRLLRRSCLHCNTAGCSLCHEGFQGRTVISEILLPKAHMPDPHISNDITHLMTFYRQYRHSTLYDSADEAVLQNKTTQAEVIRVLGPQMGVYDA